MIGVVLLVGSALGDQAEVLVGQACFHVAVFAGGVAAGFDEDVLAVAGAAYADVEALVGFFIDECVVGGRVAQGVAENLVLAFRLLVFDGVEEHRSVRCPGERADALGGVGEQRAVAQVFDVQRVLAEAGVIGGVGEQVAVGADGQGAE